MGKGGGKERNRSCSKRDIEGKMALNRDIHLERSKKTTRSSSKKHVQTKETPSSDTELGDSQEHNRSPSKQEVGTKRHLAQILSCEIVRNITEAQVNRRL
jgi:hypothetical protein